LLKDGNKIKALKRDTSNLSWVNQLIKNHNLSSIAEQNLSWVNGSLFDINQLIDQITGCESIFHCAAFVSFNSADAQDVLDVNIKGTANMVDAALSAGIKEFCYVSSTAAIGTGKKNDTITEKTPWNLTENPSTYSISKHFAEREVWRGIEEGLDAVIVNPCVVIGPGEWGKSSTSLFTTVWKGLPFYTKGSNAFVAVEDVVKALLELRKRKIYNERFLVIGENRTFKSVFDKIADSLKKKKAYIEVTPFLAAIAWRLTGLLQILTKKKSTVSRESTASSMSKKVYDSRKLVKTLDFKFTSIDEAIDRTCATFVQTNQ